MDVLIDTSTLVAWERDHELFKAAPDELDLCISVISASELLHGLERTRGAARRHRRAQFIEAAFRSFAILPINLAVAREHARIWADLQAAGNMIGAHDLLIAATALHHGLRLATRNQRDFERVEGLDLEYW